MIFITHFLFFTYNTFLKATHLQDFKSLYNHFVETCSHLIEIIEDQKNLNVENFTVLIECIDSFRSNIVYLKNQEQNRNEYIRNYGYVINKMTTNIYDNCFEQIKVWICEYLESSQSNLLFEFFKRNRKQYLSDFDKSIQTIQNICRELLQIYINFV